MSLYGKGMLITFSETPPEVEEDFNEWYNREHIDERVWMPGFHRARRYVDANNNADIKYFATYETDKVEDLADPEYMELLKDQSDWSKKVMSTFTKFDRITANVTIDLSHGFGGACLAARFFPGIEIMSKLRDNLGDNLLPNIVSKPGIIGAVLVENNLSVVNEGRRAQGMEIPENETPEWIILIEAQDNKVLSRHANKLIEAGLSEFELEPSDINIGVYNLMFGNNR
ncbi:hypothetical protein OAN59_04665 [Alphaproteobacteria bacterium]|jgi:hypothetical protein|nr:hypothetical protein [Alphaproteobacteria bacterium]